MGVELDRAAGNGDGRVGTVRDTLTRHCATGVARLARAARAHVQPKTADLVLWNRPCDADSGLAVRAPQCQSSRSVAGSAIPYHHRPSCVRGGWGGARI